jgi:hypothetical protein
MPSRKEMEKMASSAGRRVSPGTCLGSGRRPAARILASASGRGARRRPVARTVQQLAAAERHFPLPPEGGLPADDQEGASYIIIGGDAVLDGTTLLRIERFEV